MITTSLHLRYLTRLSAIAVSMVLAISMTSCGESQVNNKEVLTSVSCKNESGMELGSVLVVVGDRSLGLGYINLDKKKTMVVGNLAEAKKIVVSYSFYPANNDPKSTESIVGKTVEFPGEKLAGVAPQAGEVEVVCKGDGKWIIRVYERTDDHKGRVILEADMVEHEKKP